MPEAQCSGFEPQTYLKDRCKKCFRLKSKHQDVADSSTASSVPTTSAASGENDRNRDKRRTWRDQRSNRQENGSPEHSHEGNEDDTTSTISFKSATSKTLSTAKSAESIASNQDSRSMVTAISESLNEDDRADTPTETDVICMLETAVMKNEIAQLQEEIAKLKEEKRNWTARRAKKAAEGEQSLVDLLEERLAEAESCIQDYQDENTVLKCELRDIQEYGTVLEEGTEVSKLAGRLKASETLCEELVEENEVLKADIKDLQQEIEEMQVSSSCVRLHNYLSQDQYREEEIDEFRELQRELEQNAKNCRILQFKLRKSERLKDQLETEKQHLEAKVKDLLQASSQKLSDDGESGLKPSDSIRIKELESELRIAKEVSVRLHNELENAEERRYKLEVYFQNHIKRSFVSLHHEFQDEAFYLKEKVRELQTQSKWREARNRVELQTVPNSIDFKQQIYKYRFEKCKIKRLTELTSKIYKASCGRTKSIIRKRSSSNASEATTVQLSSNDVNKEMRDVLERESDLRDQLKFAEEDLKRTRLRIQDLESENEELLRKLTRLSSSKRPPMTRSVSEGHAQIQLELAEHEVEHLTTKVERLEQKNSYLTKRIQELETDSKKSFREGVDVAALNKSPVFIDLTPEVQRDISAMIATITDLEHKNMELSMQVKKMREKLPPDESVPFLCDSQADAAKDGELDGIDISSLESEKAIASLNKQIETLNNQLILSNERYLEMHQKLVTQYGDDVKYADVLKEKCEELEKQLSEEKAKGSLEGLHVNSNTPATTDEVSISLIEQCCEVLASVETQTNRICKQIEKIDNAQKDERRRSLSKDSSATIIAELSTVMSELKNVHNLLESHKINNPSYVRKSPVKELSSAAAPNETTVCAKCKENEAIVESQKEEIAFYKKKNKDLTNQVLQTEDRWTLEIDKQRQIYENELKNLRNTLSNVEKCVEEQNQLIESRTIALNEKSRMIQERDEKCEKLKSELQDLKNEIQAIVAEQKSAKEYEIKYKKLESLYETQVEKFNQERTKTKNEIATLKKRSDDTLLDLEKLQETYNKKAKLWAEEKLKLEEENNKLKNEIGTSVSNKDSAGETVSTAISTIHIKKDSSSNKDTISTASTSHSTMDKMPDIDKKIASLTAQLEKSKMEIEEVRAESAKKKQEWAREKESLQHKLRQDEKIRSVEFDALQQKFASRMRIMEDTNKSLHTQVTYNLLIHLVYNMIYSQLLLVQARRERDYNREALCTYERKINEEKHRMNKEEKRQCDLSQKCVEMVTFEAESKFNLCGAANSRQIAQMEEETGRLRTELTLNKQAHLADQALWEVEKSHFQKKDDLNASKESNSPSARNNSKITEGALEAAEAVQKQYADYQKFYTKEIDRLNARIRELSSTLSSKQHESQRVVRELREQIKVLEISQRNLLQARDLQMGAKEILEAEIEKLREKVHLSEVQRLTRKYKLSSVVDQLQTMVEPAYKATKREVLDVDMVKYVLSQLKTIKEEDNHTAQLLGNESYGVQASTSNASENLPAADTDAVSTSTSLRSYPNSVPSHKWLSVASALTQDNSSGKDTYINGRSPSPVKKVSTYPDPPPNFILNKDKTVEYDKDGRLHYIPKAISRFGSYDNQESLEIPHNKEVLIDGNDANRQNERTSADILHKIRREELAKGGQPSVRLMAKAFDSMEGQKHNSSKRSIFSIRKSRSVENAESAKATAMNSRTKTVRESFNFLDLNYMVFFNRNGHSFLILRNAAFQVLIPGTSTKTTVTVLGRNTSLSQIEELMGSQSPYAHATMPRGSRNPLKTIGTKIVDRVRRSLSRSSISRSSTGHNTDNDSVTGSNILPDKDRSHNSLKTVDTKPSPKVSKVFKCLKFF
uniref:JAKMIP_CC3 domain-containing protein n=1 Tax=Syphacia muris TaxID=451379 RepID=A0A0N5AHY6_9BILA